MLHTKHMHAFPELPLSNTSRDCSQQVHWWNRKEKATALGLNWILGGGSLLWILPYNLTPLHIHLLSGHRAANWIFVGGLCLMRCCHLISSLACSPSNLSVGLDSMKDLIFGHPPSCQKLSMWSIVISGRSLQPQRPCRQIWGSRLSMLTVLSWSMDTWQSSTASELC